MVVKVIGQDCICLQLTSQLRHPGILIEAKNLADGSLRKDSMILVPKNFTLHRSVLQKCLARVDLPLLDQAMHQLCLELGC